MKKTIILLVSFLSVFCLVNNSVSGDACGYIGNVLVDSHLYSFDYEGWGRMVRLNNSEYYLQASVKGCAPGAEGTRLRTCRIYSNNGTIQSHTVDTYLMGTCWYMGGDLIHFKSDLYLTVGGTMDYDRVRVYCWRVYDNNGTIEYVDYEELTKNMDIYLSPTSARNWEYASMIVLDIDVILVAFTDRSESYPVFLTSLLIDDEGTISVEKDIISVNGTAWYPELIALDEDTVGVMYRDSYGDGWLKTYDVESDGDIGDADDHYEDIWEFGPIDLPYSLDIKHVYGDKYIMAYGNSSELVLRTVRMYDNGVIIKNFVDTMEIDSTSCELTTLFRVNEDIMGIAYCGASDDGFIRTFNITYLGVFPSDTYIDTYEYWDATTYRIQRDPSVIHIADDYWTILAEQKYINDIYKQLKLHTLEIECSTGDIGGIGSLYVNCYDEGSLEPIDFNITFFDSNWGNSYSETYCNTSCTPCPCNDCSDSWNITYDQLPQGTDCIMIIGNGSYHDRYFTMDIYDEFISFEGDTYYTLCLNVFLAPESARLYNIKVIDNFYNPLDDVEIRVKRYINPTIGTIDISTLHTDSYGLAQIYLIAEVPYIFNCTREDYYPVDFIWIPPDANNVTKTIKMTWIYGEGPDIENISMDQLVLSAYNTTTMEIFYLNLNEDNQYVDISVYDYFNDSFLLTTYHITENPNNITQLFTWTDYELIGDILKVTAVATRINESTYTLTGYFNIQQAREQVGDAYLHLILSVGLCFFGLTIASPKTIFGPVGIIVMIIGLGVTAFAVQTWYIHLIQAVEIILLIFIILVFKEEGVHAI